MSVPRTARQRVHQELSAEILAVARVHLARDGAAGLSLRSVARDLEMVPSALYRYYPGRDALLSALILSAYGSLADEAERAADGAGKAAQPDAQRWLAVPRAMRHWALAHPHEWSLIFGTPVPGYQAPEDTVVPYARVAAALVRPVLEAKATGRLALHQPLPEISQSLRRAVAPVIEGLLPDLPPAQVVRALQAWTTLIGAISLELFGHWNNTILDPEAFFEETIASMASQIGLA
ncbi:MAG TPA: WHG domain-containing protein [Acidimicrobiales bacterium]|jgi:AcrR family transcriptional regulator